MGSARYFSVSQVGGGPSPLPSRPGGRPLVGHPVWARQWGGPTSSHSYRLLLEAAEAAPPLVQRFLERWSQVVCASDTTIKEAFLSQGSCPPPPIKVRPDSTLGFSLALEAEKEPALCKE